MINEFEELENIFKSFYAECERFEIENKKFAQLGWFQLQIIYL